MDVNTLKALKRSPLGLDLYMWLVYRTFNLDAPKQLSWPMLYRQFGADPDRSSDRVTVDSFRKDCLRELKKIKMAWPGSGIPDRAGESGEKDRRAGCAAVRAADPAPHSRHVAEDFPESPQGGGASAGDETHEFQNGSKAENPHHGPNPGCSPREHPGRCAGSSSCASKWTTHIHRARNASGSATPDAGKAVSRRQSPVDAPRIGQERCSALWAGPCPASRTAARGPVRVVSTVHCDFREFSTTIHPD